MKRLLLLLCLLAAAWPVAAARPEPVLFDLPYTVEYGYYIVWFDTPVGSRRFIFDTGAGKTVIRESLRDEMALKADTHTSVRDFEGHTAQMERVRIDSLRMGPVLFCNEEVIVMPDSSFIFSCFDVDGIAGSSLLQNFAIRLPNADSTITVTNDIRALGPLDRKCSSKIWLGNGRPMVPIEFAAPDKGWERAAALFDTGSSGWLSYRRIPSRNDMIDAGIAADVERTEGYPSNVGWTNRVKHREIIRGRVPEIRLAGTTLADIPFRVSEGSGNVLGTAMLQWGQAVIDYKHKRFYFLPYPDAALRAPHQRESAIKPSIMNGRLVVGQVWDEGLKELVSPGDRIVKLGTIPVDTVGVCPFLRGEIRPDKPEMTIERSDGSRVTVSVMKK